MCVTTDRPSSTHQKISKVLVDVHQRDVFVEIEQKRVRDPEDFEWQKIRIGLYACRFVCFVPFFLRGTRVLRRLSHGVFQL